MYYANYKFNTMQTNKKARKFRAFFCFVGLSKFSVLS